jgi:hypothetical protein
MLPQIAQGASNKMWIVPTELTQALRGIGAALGGTDGDSNGAVASASSNGDGRHSRPAARVDEGDQGLVGALSDAALEDPTAALERARAEAAHAVADAEGEARRTGVAGTPAPPEITDSTRPGR